MKSILTLLVLLLFRNLYSQSDINQAEYYFDTDPGFGSANAITVSAGNTFTLTNYSIATQNLPEGIHFLYIRCKDANNKWSLPIRKVMYIHPNLNASSPITNAEYYFDTDTGFGSANAITINAGNTLTLANYNIATQNLPEGIHFLYIRCKDANNKWSLPMRKVMYIHPNLNATSPITTAEYFVDTDPGVGLANAISLTAGTTVNQSFDVVTNGLAVGNHNLFVRVKNQDGVWSVISKKVFTLTSPLSVSENMFFEAKVYPNPTTGFVTIQLAQNESIRKIEIIDMLGKIVVSQNSSSNTIDLETLHSGIYFIKAFADEKVFLKKIIKQ